MGKIIDLKIDWKKYHTIAIDGLDGSGKGSCVAEMANIIASRGVSVLVVDYPHYDYPWGQFLAHLLKENDEGLSLEDRMLVYALNRLETVSLIQQKIEELSQKNEEICLLFDRYHTSNIITLAYYILQNSFEDPQNAIGKYLPKMWDIDELFVRSLGLQNGRVVVPVLDTEETLKRINTDEGRVGADLYERNDVQSLARDLYIQASDIDERIVTFSQHVSEENRYLTVEENATQSLRLGWPDVLEYPLVDNSAPIDSVELELGSVDRSALAQLLEKHASEDLKRFDPYI